MSIYFQPTALVGAIAIAMANISASAQDQFNTKQSHPVPLQTLVVTATRSAQNIEDVPARINIIEPQVVEQSALTSFPQLLKHDTALNMVQSGGFGQQSSIFLRGTESDHTLVMRDGVRLNTATSSAASLPFIDTTDIRQIEILKGPASVLYGTDAIGGVVHVVSKTPEKNAAFITGEIGENHTYKSLAGADLKQGAYYAQIRGQRLESDGTPVFTGEQRHYSYDQKGMSAKIGAEFEQLKASLDFSRNEGLNQFNKWGNLEVTDFANEIINLKGSANISPSLQLNTRLSQFKDEAHYLVSPSFIKSTAKEAELYGKWNYTSKQNLLLGVTHRQLEADTSSLKQKIDSTGYYVQHQLNNQQWHTQLGVRIEDNEKFGQHTVAQGAVRYDLNPSSSIYANIGSAFKAPTLNDLYAWGGNENLQPEKSLSYEIGLDQQLPFNLKIGSSLFYTQIDNLINSKCLSDCTDWNKAVWQNVNVDEATIRGAELYGKWQQDDYFISTSYQYSKTRDEHNGLELLRRPRQSLSVTAGLQNAQYGLSTAITAKSSAKDFSDDENGPLSRVPGYTTIDLNAYWNVSPKLKLFSNIENVGDVKFKTAYNGADEYYVNGGRLASMGMTLKY